MAARRLSRVLPIPALLHVAYYETVYTQLQPYCTTYNRALSSLMTSRNGKVGENVIAKLPYLTRLRGCLIVREYARMRACDEYFRCPACRSTSATQISTNRRSMFYVLTRQPRQCARPEWQLSFARESPLYCVRHTRTYANTSTSARTCSTRFTKSCICSHQTKILSRLRITY